MFVDFDSIFNKPPIDWSKVNLTDNPPCKSCNSRFDLWDSEAGCSHCMKRLNYIIDCISKLAWYEEKEKKNAENR